MGVFPLFFKYFELPTWLEIFWAFIFRGNPNFLKEIRFGIKVDIAVVNDSSGISFNHSVRKL